MAPRTTSTVRPANGAAAATTMTQALLPPPPPSLLLLLLLLPPMVPSLGDRGAMGNHRDDEPATVPALPATIPALPATVRGLVRVPAVPAPARH